MHNTVRIEDLHFSLKNYNGKNKCNPKIDVIWLFRATKISRQILFEYKLQYLRNFQISIKNITRTQHISAETEHHILNKCCDDLMHMDSLGTSLWKISACQLFLMTHVNCQYEIKFVHKMVQLISLCVNNRQMVHMTLKLKFKWTKGSYTIQNNIVLSLNTKIWKIINL